MAIKHKIKFDQLSPHQALLLTRVLSETRGLLKGLTSNVAQCLSQAKALREGTATDLNGMTFRITTAAKDIRQKLEQASYKFIGLDLPIESSQSQTITLIEALFEDENNFDQVVRSRGEEYGVNESWLKELKDLVIRGHRNVTPLFAQLTYATKSGLLMAVDGEGSISKELFSLPSARALAGNSTGPHPVSGPNCAGPAERKSFEFGNHIKGKPIFNPNLPKTIVYDTSAEDAEILANLAQIKKFKPVKVEKHEKYMTAEAGAAAQDTATAIPPPPPHPFAGVSPKASRRTEVVKRSESTTQLRRRKRFE